METRRHFNLPGLLLMLAVQAILVVISFYIIIYNLNKGLITTCKVTCVNPCQSLFYTLKWE